MFDPMFDQAAGLRAVGMPGAVRLVPVVLSRDLDTAFEALCQLGDGLLALGYPVVALDASCLERAGRVGLSSMLHAAGGAPRINTSKLTAVADHAGHGWPSLPAQTGLGSLLHLAASQGARQALQRLASVFALNTVVLVLAPKEWLSVLFEDSDAQPLVPFALQPSGVVDAYGAIKVLSQAGGLQPVLLPVASGLPDEVERRSLAALLDTADKHLGFRPESLPWMASMQADEALASRPVGPWVLRMAESALVMGGDDSPPLTWSTPNQREALVPQLWSR